MIRRLKPLDDSIDLVAITDDDGTTLGCLHIDAFLDGYGEPNPIHQLLFCGHEVCVQILPLGKADE